MAASSIPMPVRALDGLVELPPGKIAAVATYLRMTAPPPALMREPPAGALARLAGDPGRYRALYRAVGEGWLWFSRAGLPDAKLAEILDHPAVEALALVEGGRDIGIAELDFRQGGECELAFFGLVPEATGHGRGRPLLAEAVRRAFARPVRRLWLHTCTLDHPAALPFYLAAGFRPYRRAIEIADDPRLTGQMPRGAAPHVPIV